jgi:hypothetical protein
VSLLEFFEDALASVGDIDDRLAVFTDFGG